MKWLITAGPTREPLDPVRFLSNRSSGKMGYALAAAAAAAGEEVLLVSGPTALPVPQGVTRIDVVTSDEMAVAVDAGLEGVDVAVLAAAVCDFKPAEVFSSKIKKHDGIPALSLVPTRDILASLGALEGRGFFLAGFAAETDRVAEHAQRKLEAKRCDLIIANDVSVPGIGFEGEENEVTLFWSGGGIDPLPRAGKGALGRQLVAIIREAALRRRSGG